MLPACPGASAVSARNDSCSLHTSGPWENAPRNPPEIFRILTQMMQSASRALLVLLLANPALTLRAPAFARVRAPVAPPPPPPAPAWEKPLLQACAAGWVLGCPLVLTSALPLIETTFGLAQTTFEDKLRDPAGGFLALTSPLGPLEGFLCLSLASTDDLTPEDRSRIGAALVGTSGATLAALAVAFATGLSVTDVPVFLAATGLVSATGFLGLRAANEVADPLELYKADAVQIAPFVGERTPSASSTTSLFYRSSTLVGTLVGLSFIFSPLSPIALFDTPEAPATHLMRQLCGSYIVFCLAPVQAALFRAAKAGTLADEGTRMLNVVTGLCCGLLVCDGKYQTSLGTEAFQNLDPAANPELYAAITAALGDPQAVGRAQTNTDAAFTVGLLVAAFYLLQALTPPRQED